MNLNKFAADRLFTGLLFIGLGIFAMVNGTAGLFLMRINLLEFKNLIGLVLIVFGALITIRAFTKY